MVEPYLTILYCYLFKATKQFYLNIKGVKKKLINTLITQPFFYFEIGKFLNLI